RNQIVGRPRRSSETTSRRLHQNRDGRGSKTNRAGGFPSRRRSPCASGKLRHLLTAKIAVRSARSTSIPAALVCQGDWSTDILSPWRHWRAVEKSCGLPIVQSLTIEDLRHATFNPRLPGLGLFGCRKIEQVSSLPSRRQCIESSFQSRAFIEFLSKFLRNDEF